MKPLDPRLLRYAHAARSVFGAGAALGLARTVAILVWCWSIAQLLAVFVLPVLGGAGGSAGRVGEGVQGEAQVPLLLAMAVAALALRAISGWGIDTVAARGAIRVKAQLRASALDAIDANSPAWRASRSDAGPATALGRGLDALDGYFSGYVPQLILAVCATPVLVLAVLVADPVSGVTVLIVFPVIPLFMVLIGLATQSVQDRQWAQLQRLSASFLDVVEGLSTLKIFRREHRQTMRIAQETEEYRSRTLRVLRVTFLSGFVLDLAGTFSIALVAVTVGTRLVNGEFPLALGLFVLLLLPEVFIPVRQVGAAYHASTEGLAAAQQVFEIIEHSKRDPGSEVGSEVPLGTSVAEHDPHLTGRDSDGGLHLSGLVVTRNGRRVAGPVDLDVAPGEVVALAGPSGAGKSTILATVLGFLGPEQGEMRRAREVSWVGQQPGLLQGTVAWNVALGSPLQPERAREALDAVGLSDIALDQQLGALGSGLSGGQAQRVAIARGLYRAWTRDAGLLLFDEPSSALDAMSEGLVATAIRAEADAGRAVLVVSHRDALIASADRVVNVTAPVSEGVQT